MQRGVLAVHEIIELKAPGTSTGRSEHVQKRRPEVLRKCLEHRQGLEFSGCSINAYWIKTQFPIRSQSFHHRIMES